MPTLPLVPLPRAVTRDAAAPPFRLDEAVVVSGAGSTELSAALAARTALAIADAGPDVETGTATAARSIRLSIGSDGPAESYTLTVDAAGVRLGGADAAGLFYAARSLIQLVDRDPDGWFVPAVQIDDAPRFAYRGVMLDAARHFLPVDVVKGYIDRASSLKCNHLHLHLTDDQGWRIQVAGHPGLTEIAASSAVGGETGGFYSEADYAEIVAHAASRHMTIVPEVDVPGHTHAVGLVYPHLAADPVITDEVRDAAAQFGGGLPTPGEAYTGFAVGFSSLRVDEEATYAFLTDVFGALARATPGPYLHLGGDEALGTAPSDYARFLRRTVDIVRATGKTPVLWHEAGAVDGLGSDLVAQYWGYVRPDERAAAAARAVVDGGGHLILSPADAAYLDMKPSPDFPLGLDWANGATSLDDAYGWDPAAVVDGVGDADILGVEAPMFSETVRTASDIDALAFPRLAAIAEIAWSSAPSEPTPPATTPPSGPTDPDAAAPTPAARTLASFRERVGGLAPLWRAAGIGYDPMPDVPWRSA